MNKNVVIAFMLITLALLVSGCASTPQVTRVSSDTQTDLSGYWND